MSKTSKLDTFLASHPGVEHVELVLVDPSGVLRGKWAPVSTLKKAFAEGVNFPLSLHGLDVWGNEVEATGLHISSGDLDGFCLAIPHTLSAVPWGSNRKSGEMGDALATTAQVILKTQTPDHTPFGGCSRTVLERAVNALAAEGLTAVCAFELEFHLFKPEEEWLNGTPELASFNESPDAQFMYGLDALAENSDLFADIRRAASWAQLPIDTIVKEAGPGQFEVNLAHRADALRAADDVILLKRIIMEASRKHGLRASFMAKPFTDQPGNGMHVHASLLDTDGNNIFSGDEGTERQHSAVSGLLNTMEEMTLVFINSRNGFRRMAPGSYAPTRVNWGENNRSVSVRLPAAPDSAKRVEHRVAGADANPYLVLAAILQAMLGGIKGKLKPGPQLVGNAYEEETKNRGPQLPSTQEKALEAFSGSTFADEALGEQMKHILSSIKQAEIDGFANDISPLEWRTFL